MTKSELVISTRNLVSAQVPRAKGSLPDAVLLDLINDATEEVVLDLVPFMPLQFCGTETISLVNGTGSYALSNEYLEIYKVEKNVSDNNPTEIEIIDPLDKQFAHYVDETEDEPKQCYFLGDTVYFVPTPSADKTDYVKIYFVRPEAAVIATAGPSYIPRTAHRLICYKAATLAAGLYGGDVNFFISLYRKRLKAFLDVYNRKFQQKVRFVRPSVSSRITRDTRENIDWDWR